MHKKNYKDLVIYYTRYDNSKSIKMMSLSYHELVGKIKEHEGKNTLMIDSYVLDKVLDKIKEIVVIEKFDDFKVLINTIRKCCDINDIHNYS